MSKSSAVNMRRVIRGVQNLALAPPEDGVCPQDPEVITDQVEVDASTYPRSRPATARRTSLRGRERKAPGRFTVVRC